MNTITVNAMGDACPLPVIKTRNALAAMQEPGTLQVLADNDTAVQNLLRFAAGKGCPAFSKKTGEAAYEVTITVLQPAAEGTANDCPQPQPENGAKEVVVIGSEAMGNGDDQLGKNLMKAFIFALTQMEKLPDTIIFYNSGVKLSTEGSPALEDLKKLETQGVEILSCGTCLNFFGLKEKLAVGSISNMYDIVEKQSAAAKILRP